MYLTFTKPSYLLLLLIVIPAFILIYLMTLKQRKTRAFKFANFEAIEKITGVRILSKNLFLLYLNLAVILFLFLGLAGTTLHYEGKQSTFSYVLAIDSSRSMLTTDISPNRMEAAKKYSIYFVDATPVGTEIGVVSFSGGTYIRSEITEDKTQVKDSIRNIGVGVVGGTDILDAVVTSSNLLREYDSKAVILISDGQLNVGDAPQIIRYINRNNVIVNTIAVGTEEGGVSEFDTISKVDEDFLKSLAFNSRSEERRVGKECRSRWSPYH